MNSELLGDPRGAMCLCVLSLRSSQVDRAAAVQADGTFRRGGSLRGPVAGVGSTSSTFVQKTIPVSVPVSPLHQLTSKSTTPSPSNYSAGSVVVPVVPHKVTPATPVRGPPVMLSTFQPQHAPQRAVAAQVSSVHVTHHRPLGVASSKPASAALQPRISLDRPLRCHGSAEGRPSVHGGHGDELVGEVIEAYAKVQLVERLSGQGW